MKKNNPFHPFTTLIKNTALKYPEYHKEEKYRALVENSVHAFFLTLSDGTVLETNNAATAMFGYTPLEFKHLKRWHILDHTDPALLHALAEREKNGFALTEATGIRKNGERFPVEISSSIFKDVHGVNKSSTMVSDISLRKKAEAAMQLSNERYDLVVKATKDLVWDWNLVTGEIYRSGSNLRDVYGHSSNDLIKTIKDWSAFIHPDDKERIKGLISYYKNSTEETGFNFEYRFRKEDGSYVYINDKGYLIRNDDGKVIRMIGAAEDITERKQSVLAIEESEQRYKMFLEQSTEGIWRIELNEPMHIRTPLDKMLTYSYQHAHIAECNDVFAKTYGFNKAADIIGTPLNKILPDTNPLNEGYFVKFFSQGFKVQDEISYEIDSNGNQLVFMNNMVGIVEGDYIKRAWGTQRNITGHKKAEQALADSENRLRAIVQTDPECIKLLNSEGIILEMNPAGLAMIEADNAGQVLGRHAVDLVLPQYKDAFKQLVADVFEGRSGKLVFEINGLKGKKSFLETHCVPLKNGVGDITALLSVTRDITESKNAQARLMASEERYRYLFNNNPASIIIWDIETLKIIEVNETAVDLYGYTRDEFLKLTLADLQPAGEQDKFASLYENNLYQAENMETVACRHITREGVSIIMEINRHKIKYKGKNAVLALANDITEKVQLENSLTEERQIRHQQITEAVILGQEKERTELGQELHDNINQILASTKLYIECALKDKNPRMDLIAESKILVEKAMAEIRNMSKSLLPPSLGEIGLLQALSELVENIKQVNDLNISIDWEIVDENKIGGKLKLTIFRIVQEQLNNIIKHANAKNAVIHIENTAGKIRLLVKDDGLGFNTALKRNGVGLRNISSRAEVNNGTVSVISNPGEGCELIISFPEKNTSPRTIIKI
jgi:PAS domain S-box-containing protein